MHVLVFKNVVGKYMSILRPANRSGHKFREIEGVPLQIPLFLENETVNLYFNFHNFNSLGWFFAAIYDLFVGICCERCSDEICYKELYK